MPNNDKKFHLTKQDRIDAINEIQKLIQHASFMADLLNSNHFGVQEADVHMGLMRHSYDSLAGIFKTDKLSSDLEDAYKMLRGANQRAHALEKQLGNTISCEAALNRLKTCESWFRTWYLLKGWTYMSIQWEPGGLMFDTSDEVDHKTDYPEEILTGDRELAFKIAPVVPYGFDGFDKARDTFNDQLLDTQGNHEKLEAMFKTDFPNAEIYEFKSRLERRTGRLLRISGRVPYTDIESWREKALNQALKITGRNTGSYYSRKAGLAALLADKTYTSHAEKSEIRASRGDLSWLKFVTGLWDKLCKAQDDENNAGKAVSLTQELPGSTYVKSRLGSCSGANFSFLDDKYFMLEFPAGASFEQMAGTFGELFSLDWKKDLKGDDVHGA